MPASSKTRWRKCVAGTNPRLEAVFHAEGRVYNTNVGTGSSTLVFRYEYAIRDHLGNTRILFTDKNNNG